MMTEMSAESALADNTEPRSVVTDVTIDDQRMRHYRILATAFCYPDDKFFAAFPNVLAEKRDLLAEYDRLFRAGIVWLYGAEHLIENEFQRAKILSDIMGFYTAFAFEPVLDRPDAIACELEFMFGLILKRTRAGQAPASDESGERIEVCLDAEKKFFVQHLEPGAAAIAEKIISQSKNSFYVDIAKDLLELLAAERKLFDLITAEDAIESKKMNVHQDNEEEEIVDDQ